MKSRTRVAVVTAVLLLVIMGYFTWAVSKGERVAGVGAMLPDIELPSLGGNVISLSRFRGQPVIIDFFTTWCNPCQAEAPALAQLSTRWQGKVKLVMIDRSESRYMVKKFANAYHLTAATLLLDQNDRWASRLGVTGQPETFLVNAKGVIQRHVNHQMTTAQLQALFAQAASQ